MADKDSETYDPYAMPADAIVPPPSSLGRAMLQIGPGIILAGSIIGSGELLLTTKLGADYGFVFLGLILYSCIIKVFVQIELGRHAISAGTPTLGAINQLPGWRLGFTGGAHWLVWWWLIMLLATVTQLGAMAGGVGQAVHLAFPGLAENLASHFDSWAPSLATNLRKHTDSPGAILAAVGAVALLLSGGYRRIEFITTLMIAGVTAITVLCVLALPFTGYPLRVSDFRGAFQINIAELPRSAIAAAFATFGITGVGATELYAYPYWCLEKGYARFAGVRSPDVSWVERARGWIRVMYLDAWVSMVVFTVATVCFYLLGAKVLHTQNLHPEGPKMIATLSEMYVPMFGEWTQLLFLTGVLAVLFKTLYVASASHSRLTADFLSLAGFVQFSDGEARARWVRFFCVCYPLGALIVYLWFRQPQALVIFGGFFQGLTLPVIAAISLFFRYFRTDPRLAPSLLSDLCLWGAFVSMFLVAIYAVWDLTTKIF